MVLASALLAIANLATLSVAVRDPRFNANARRVPAVPLDDAPAPGPIISRNGTALPPYNTTYYFNQLIDHNHPELGTFQQRYWHTYEFYEPGGPIILMTPGEINANGYADRYLSNQTINGRIAQQQNGAAIVLEHRFYGLSNPYPDLSVKSFAVHNIQQAIEDLVYFANNVNMPMPNGNNLGPATGNAPWLLIGGSYSGALTSWTMVNKPGVFWAGYGSSGVVEAILNFWQYFEPIREHMAVNCSADVQTVITHIDKTFTGKNLTAINAIKENFGLSALDHLDDVAGALRNNLWDWQSLQPRTGPGATFFQFCDALEVKNGVSASAKGWGLDHALAAWGAFWKNGYLANLCGGTTDDIVKNCLGTYDPNAEWYTSTEIDNNLRSWNWIVCNEVGYLQEGAPVGHPSLVTRLVQPPYDLRQCQLMFPEAFPHSVPMQKGVDRTNRVYEGWDVKLNRVLFVNGQRDPWRDATVSAEGRHPISTPQQRVLLGEGFHCSDLSTLNTLVNPNMAQIQEQALSYFKGWLKGWKPSGNSTTKPPAQPPQGHLATDAKTTAHIPRPVNAWFKRF